MTFCKHSITISCQIFFVNKHWPQSCICPFKWLLVGVIRCNHWSFLAKSVIFMKSHTLIVKTLSEHVSMVILHFGSKCWVLFNKNSFISQNSQPFTETTAMNTFSENWSDHFSRFHRYKKFKKQRNKSEWCKTFFEEYAYNRPDLNGNNWVIMSPSKLALFSI